MPCKYRRILGAPSSKAHTRTAYSYDDRGNVTQIIDALNTDANCELVTDRNTWDFTYTDLDIRHLSAMLRSAREI